MLRFLLIIALLAAATPWRAAANDSGLLIYTEQFPPYNFRQGDALVGINLELVKRACNDASLHCQFLMTHWNRAFREAQGEGNYGIVSISRHAAREPFFQWVGPLVKGESGLYRMAHRDDIVVSDDRPVTSYTVGIPRNDVYHRVLTNMGFEDEKTLLTFSSRQQAIRLFVMGKLDLMVGSNLTLPYQLAEQGTPLEVTQVERFASTYLQGNYLGLSHSVDGQWVEALQAAIDRLRARGEFERLQHKYLQNATRMPPPQQ
ncbi:transporter substrate-binding domain-containing protein [Aestuariibacter halophilus]|uniref:Transporter substrate-binding domain-containing protein n=1 Tax=Fluctibacter halophilus TaxID=226011 RepID=A0ABS8G2G0_9ALTE|nr:transporter substrate-binding domain-containing protein [Aestuariibacter halophilus]MCC2614713.1 transporter substrate-binding domain-containing protein [Aestuariibacter halophilus]